MAADQIELNLLTARMSPRLWSQSESHELSPHAPELVKPAGPFRWQIYGSTADDIIDKSAEVEEALDESMLSPQPPAAGSKPPRVGFIALARAAHLTTSVYRSPECAFRPTRPSYMGS